jgi:hypothetical protein
MFRWSPCQEIFQRMLDIVRCDMTRAYHYYYYYFIIIIIIITTLYLNTIHCLAQSICNYVNNTGQQDLNFFVPRTSIGELSSTFMLNLDMLYIIFLSGRVSKI